MNILATLALCYVGMGLLLRFMSNQIIFIPSRAYDVTPRLLGLSHEEIRIATDDGVSIQSWLLLCPGAQRTILFLHGNAGNMSGRLENGVMLTRLGFNVLLLDYRGYGSSEGSPSPEGTERDARAAFDYLTGRPELSRGGVLIYGRSVGSAPAIHLASRVRAAGLIVESGFVSLRGLARDLALYSFFLPFVPDLYDSISRIHLVPCPVLVLHGTRDEIIPFSHGRRLYEAAPEPKQFFEIQGAYHNDWYARDPKSYFAAWQGFIDSLPQPANPEYGPDPGHS